MDAPTHQSMPRGNSVLPLSHVGYATVEDVVAHIASTRVSKVPLKAEDIECIITSLIYDGTVEKLQNGTYRALVRRATGAGVSLGSAGRDPTRSGLTNIPCGHCQLLNFCKADGPVNPMNCEYFSKWFDL